jgi:hypothetical protein
MAKRDATQLAFQFSLRPWGSSLIKTHALATAMTSSSSYQSFFLRNTRMMPFTTRLVWTVHQMDIMHNQRSLTLLNPEVFAGVLHLLYKSGRFCQLGFSNHSGRWKDFQSKIRLAVKTGRTQRCMMWHA